MNNFSWSLFVTLNNFKLKMQENAYPDKLFHLLLALNAKKVCSEWMVVWWVMDDRTPAHTLQNASYGVPYVSFLFLLSKLIRLFILTVDTNIFTYLPYRVPIHERIFNSTCLNVTAAHTWPYLWFVGIKSLSLGAIMQYPCKDTKFFGKGKRILSVVERWTVVLAVLYSTSLATSFREHLKYEVQLI